MLGAVRMGTRFEGAVYRYGARFQKPHDPDGRAGCVLKAPGL
jgi:hypothetical protein